MLDAKLRSTTSLHYQCYSLCTYLVVWIFRCNALSAIIWYEWVLLTHCTLSYIMSDYLLVFHVRLFSYFSCPIICWILTSTNVTTTSTTFFLFFSMSNAPISFTNIHYFGTTFFYAPSSARHPHSSLLLAHHLPTRKKMTSTNWAHLGKYNLLMFIAILEKM